MRWLLLPLTAALSCAPGAADVKFTDEDGDGYDGAEDCDDTDPDVNPDATEVWYDGVDSDCDGWSDYDADWDEYDDLAYGGEDCDDRDSDTYPGAEEGCDGVDRDCDGVIGGEGDADGDGYLAEACGGTDCDDGDADIHPGAPDDCDGLDEDCSGAIDDGGRCPCDVVNLETGTYQLCVEAEDWDKAAERCATYGYHLATIDDATEGELLTIEAFALDEKGDWWIGLTDAEEEGVWAWMDGAPVNFTNWADGEPNDAGSGEDCAYLYDDGTWNDGRCSKDGAYICEADPSR